MFGENHAHIFMNAINYKKAVKCHEKGVQEQVIRAHFQAYKEKGISFVRDGGDSLHVSERARELAGEYGALVCKVKAMGGDFIKIMTTGIMDFATDGSVTETALKKEEVREMVHIAHEEGLAVMSHTNGAKAVADVVEAGADSIEHGNYVDEDTLKLMAQSQVVWVPTITVVKNLIGCGRFSDEVLNKIWETGSRNIRRGYELGVQMALGSDAGAYLVPHGQGLLDELACFQEILGEEKALFLRLSKGEKIIREKFKKRY